MSRLTDSLLSGSRGRIGRLVVANVYGTEILRQRPKRSSKPATPKQLLVQNRMKQCADFISGYRDFAKVYFGQRIGLRSPFTLAMTNLMENFQLNFATMTISPNYPLVQFAKGMLLGPVPTMISSPAAATLKVDWSDNSAGNAIRADDQLQLLYLPEGDRKTVFLQNLAARSAGTFTVNVPTYLTGKTLHVWMAFLSTDGLTVSDSAYMGTTVIV